MSDEGRHNKDIDPADRREPELETAAERADVPEGNRAHNAGGTMSETLRSRAPDLDDDAPDDRK